MSIPDTLPTMQIPPTGGVHAKVEKGMAGKYGWSLSMTLAVPPGGSQSHEAAEKFGHIIALLKHADEQMRKEFGGEPA